MNKKPLSKAERTDVDDYYSHYMKDEHLNAWRWEEKNDWYGKRDFSSQQQMNS